MFDKTKRQREKILKVLHDQELDTQAIEKFVNHIIPISYGKTFSLLHKMESEGLIVSRWGLDRPIERGGCRIRLYKLRERENVKTATKNSNSIC